MKELYKFFKYNGKVTDVLNYNPDFLKIFSREVLTKIENNEQGWEELLPSGVPEIIKKNQLFGCKSKPSKKATVTK